mmetsp:Transcript_2128/g.3056  ORF Transcript_2128/g.3056 Transcript_2128/m.3056 type:complete len:235 (-) Transcript_2128:148-852(-)
MISMLSTVTIFLALRFQECFAKVDLPALPYDYKALEPIISSKTLEYHHDKHHAKYVATTNSMIAEESGLGDATLEEIMKQSYGSNIGLYNNAAQAWNHAFYWNCMKAKGGGKPTKQKKLMGLIKTSFGSFDVFVKEFSNAANTAFGSGWAWLVLDSESGKLLVTKTIGAENPMNVNSNWIPILTCDVWEHAYYLDYQNLRPTYTHNFLEKLVNWDFVADNLETASAKRGVGSEL